jgi:hypothetical protein
MSPPRLQQPGPPHNFSNSSKGDGHHMQACLTSLRQSQGDKKYTLSDRINTHVCITTGMQLTVAKSFMHNPPLHPRCFNTYEAPYMYCCTCTEATLFRHLFQRCCNAVEVTWEQSQLSSKSLALVVLNMLLYVLPGCCAQRLTCRLRNCELHRPCHKSCHKLAQHTWTRCKETQSFNT